MDRLNKVHRAYRVSLPESIVDFDVTETNAGRTSWSAPIIPRYVGIIGFLTVAAMMVVAAAALALSIS